MTPDCRLTSWMVEGAIDSDMAIAMLDEFAARLTRKTVVMLDNAPIHRSHKFMARIDAWARRNLQIYFLPPYSPELNLIEILWKRIKHYWLPFDAFLNFQNLKERLADTIALVGIKWIINFY
jgi:hypothetical protein